MGGKKFCEGQTIKKQQHGNTLPQWLDRCMQTRGANDHRLLAREIVYVGDDVGGVVPRERGACPQAVAWHPRAVCPSICHLNKSERQG